MCCVVFHSASASFNSTLLTFNFITFYFTNFINFLLYKLYNFPLSNSLLFRGGKGKKYFNKAFVFFL